MAYQEDTDDKKLWFQIITSSFPKVKINFHGQPNNVDEFDLFTKQLDRLFDRKQKFQILVNTKGLGSLKLTYVSRLSDWIKKNHDKSKEFIRCTAVIVKSKTVRAFLKALLMIVTTASPLKIFSDTLSALSYLEWPIPSSLVSSSSSSTLQSRSASSSSSSVQSSSLSSSLTSEKILATPV